MKEAVLQEAGMFTTELGFSEHAISSMGPILWCDQMLRKWPLMQWIGKHLMAMKTGSSAARPDGRSRSSCTRLRGTGSRPR